MRSTFRSLARLTRQALRGAEWKDRVTAFLCGGLVSMGWHRTFWRNHFHQWLDRRARGDDLSLRLRINGRVICLLMRKGNLADYLIGGEMVWDIYTPPEQIPSLIVDGGANIGMFSLLAHARFPQTSIICYEPDTANLQQLDRNLKINNIPATVFPKGLWSSETILYYHPSESQCGYIDHSPSDYPVNCTTPILEEGCWLKLDIEGAEYEVVPWMTGKGEKPSLISMEIHHNRTRGAALIQQLSDAGYILLTPYNPAQDCANIMARLEPSGHPSSPATFSSP